MKCCKVDMKSRIEYKYGIQLNDYLRIKRDISYFSVLDHNADKQKTSYEIMSVYYDNHNLISYHDKIGGQEKKFKVRLRIYPNGTGITNGKLEIKEKIKDRIFKQYLIVNINKHELRLVCIDFTSLWRSQD